MSHPCSVSHPRCRVALAIGLASIAAGCGSDRRAPGADVTPVATAPQAAPGKHAPAATPAPKHAPAKRPGTAAAPASPTTPAASPTTPATSPGRWSGSGNGVIPVITLTKPRTVVITAGSALTITTPGRPALHFPSGESLRTLVAGTYRDIHIRTSKPWRILVKSHGDRLTPEIPTAPDRTRRFSGTGTTKIGTFTTRGAVFEYATTKPPLTLQAQGGPPLTLSAPSGVGRIPRGTYRGVEVRSTGRWKLKFVENR